MTSGDWALLLMGALTAILLALVTPVYAENDLPKDESPYVDESCAASFACQDVIIYELVYAGIVVSFGDMTAQECEDMKGDIQKSTGAMSDLKCRPRLVERQEL